MLKIHALLDIIFHLEVDSNERISKLNELMERAELLVQVTCF